MAAEKRRLLDHVPFSQICDELHISVNTFYLWPKDLFENGHRAFQKNGRHAARAEEERQKRIVEATTQTPPTFLST